MPSRSSAPAAPPARPRARPAGRRATPAAGRASERHGHVPGGTQPQPPSRTSRPAAPSSLATSRLASRSAPASAAPDRPTPTCAQPGRPRSCDEREQARVEHLERAASWRREPHARAGLQQRGRVPVDVEERARRTGPSSRQPPGVAAG